MAKKTSTQTTSITTDTIMGYKAQRDAFVKRLTVLIEDRARVNEETALLNEKGTRIDEEKRLIEEALAADGGGGASESRAFRKAANRVGKNGKAAKPTGAIMPAIWDYLLKKPGAKSAEIRSGIRINGKSLAQTLRAAGVPKAKIEEKSKMSMGTALNAMKKTGRLIVKGDRSNYKYYVNA